MALTDFTFVPDGGSDSDRLSRHPRNRSVWGLDVHSLDVAGMWTLRFEIDGPQGASTGDLATTCSSSPGRRSR